MKAIMVFDFSDGFDIPFEDIKTKVVLSAKDEDNLEYILYLKYDDEIKLKPIPQKRELEKSGNSLIDDCKEYYIDGWNDCIDEILGDTE